MRYRVVAGVALALAIAAGAFALDKPAEPPAAADSGFLTVGKRYNFYGSSKVALNNVTLLAQYQGKWAKVQDPAIEFVEDANTDKARRVTIPGQITWLRLDSFDIINEIPDAPPAAKK